MATDEQNEREFEAVVGARIKMWRDVHSVTQDVVARVARRMGFGWSRSSVAMLEQGKRNLSAQELLALPLILEEASQASPIRHAKGFGLPQLLNPGDGGPLKLSDDLSLTLDQINGWLGGTVPVSRVKEHAGPGEPERLAAAALGLQVEDVDDIAHGLWARSLTEERDARAAKRVVGPASDDRRALQAVRGHITRELLDEMRDAIAQME